MIRSGRLGLQECQTSVWPFNSSRVQFKDIQNTTEEAKAMVIEAVKREEAAVHESDLLCNCAEGLL